MIYGIDETKNLVGLNSQYKGFYHVSYGETNNIDIPIENLGDFIIVEMYNSFPTSPSKINDIRISLSGFKKSGYYVISKIQSQNYYPLDFGIIESGSSNFIINSYKYYISDVDYKTLLYTNAFYYPNASNTLQLKFATSVMWSILYYRKR